jgi:hypothetical protein
MTRQVRIEFARSSLSPLPPIGNAKQVIFLLEKDFADFLRSLVFGGKKISLPITCLLSNEEPLSSTYGNS